MEAWAHGVNTLAKIANRYPQSAYAVLGMSLQLEWQYVKRTVPGVGSLMGPIEDSLREAFFPALFGVEEVSVDLIKILGHSVKRGGLGILEPRLLAKRAYNISKASSEVLVGSCIVGTDLKYVEHKGCVRRAIADGKEQRKFLEKAVMTRHKKLAYKSGLNCLRQETENGA